MVGYNIPEMEAKEFALWQALLEKRTGLWLPESRKAFLVAGLVKYMKEKKIAKYQDLYLELDEEVISFLDWASLVDILTVHETYYYRDQDSLKLVTNYCRNKVLANFKKQPDETQELQIWSVGCSTGEEVYSLAIEMDKLNIGLQESSGKSIYFGVTGADISYPSLAVAREGIYAERQFDFVPQSTKNFYFNKLADDYYQVKDHIKQRTCFIQSNVLDVDDKIKQKFDVIYCQNVLIYFRKERKKLVIEHLIQWLKPGGLLVLGHGEVTSIESNEMTKLDNKHCLAYIRNNK